MNMTKVLVLVFRDVWSFYSVSFAADFCFIVNMFELCKFLQLSLEKMKQFYPQCYMSLGVDRQTQATYTFTTGAFRFLDA